MGTDSDTRKGLVRFDNKSAQIIVCTLSRKLYVKGQFKKICFVFEETWGVTFVEIKSASYPFLRMDVRLFLCFNPVLGEICISIRFGQQMDEENALYLWAIL